MRSAIAAICVLALIAGCTSIHNPPATQPALCESDPALLGVWTDARMTPLGPVWLRFSFTADCHYTSRVQLLFARITESGAYSARDDIVSFDRQPGATRWPYRVRGDGLVLQEARDESYRYRRR